MEAPFFGKNLKSKKKSTNRILPQDFPNQTVWENAKSAFREIYPIFGRFAQTTLSCRSSIDMYNNDVGKESADLKAATLYFAS